MSEAANGTRGRLRILCRPATANGFGLTSLPVVEASDVGNAVKRLQEMARQGDVAVVLVEEELERALPDSLLRELERDQRPLVVPFPGPRWRGETTAEERVVELLRRAIGYRVKL